MFRILIVLVVTSSPAFATEQYCRDDDLASITPVDGGYVLLEGQTRHFCAPRDAKWHVCDNRADYLVHFEQRDGKIYISQPSYPDGEFTAFEPCQ